MRIEFVYVNDKTFAVNVQVQSFGKTEDTYVSVPASKGVVIHYDIPEGGKPYLKDWGTSRVLLSYTGPRADLAPFPVHKAFREEKA